jgi:vacuolar-type H+-ATPase subunit I/STV1
MHKSALLLAVLTALTACGRPVQQGQIFIATQAGENVKLGAVEILAFDEATIASFVKHKQMEIAQQRDKLRQEADAAKTEVERTAGPYAKAMAEYNDAVKQYDRQFDVVRQQEEKLGEIRDQYDPSTFAYSDAESAEIRQRITEQQTALSTEKQKLEKLKAEIAEKQKPAELAKEASNAAQAKLTSANRAITDFAPIDDWFKDLPHPAAQTVSDAEGKFRLELPSGGRWAVFAHAQRTIAQTENFYWLVWTDGKGGLLLNNANLFGTASPDQVVGSITHENYAR